MEPSADETALVLQTSFVPECDSELCYAGEVSVDMPVRRSEWLRGGFGVASGWLF